MFQSLRECLQYEPIREHSPLQIQGDPKDPPRSRRPVDWTHTSTQPLRTQNPLPTQGTDPKVMPNVASDLFVQILLSSDSLLSSLLQFNWVCEKQYLLTKCVYDRCCSWVAHDLTDIHGRTHTLTPHTQCIRTFAVYICRYNGNYWT